MGSRQYQQYDNRTPNAAVYVCYTLPGMITESSSIIEAPTRDELIDAFLRRAHLTPISSVEAGEILDEWNAYGCLDYVKVDGQWAVRLKARSRWQ
jgi:hypothetical protein